MHKLRFLLFALLGIGHQIGFSQEDERKEIELIHAERFTVDKTTPEGASKLKGDVQLRHQDAIMYCDSAFLYGDNSLDAFGNVKIEEGDSLTLKGDSLFYDGESRLAKVRGKVIIDNDGSILRTSFLDYYRDKGMAHYYGGGVIDSEKDDVTLTSDIGYYFSESKVFHYKSNVVMVHPDYTIKTDTMQYAPDLEKTWFFGPTYITFDARDIYCERGWFEQKSSHAVFIQNAEIKDKNQILRGDTIDYDKNARIGISKCNVVLIDTNEKFEVNGDYSIYHEEDSTSMVTKNVMLKQDMEGDTLFLTADTLFSELDSNNKRVIKTYHHSIFYRSDMQGKCDSLFYHSEDSIFFMFNDPILWSDENQLTADSIRMTMAKGNIDRMYMDQNAFIIAYEDSVFYNQIKGRNMVGKFKDDELRTVDVFGNGETVYYPREEDQTLIGINQTQCSNMKIRIDSNQIRRIHFYDQPDATLTPSDDMPSGGVSLEGFVWRQEERPTSEDDLFDKYLEMKLADDMAEMADSLSIQDDLSTKASTKNEVQNESGEEQTENEDEADEVIKEED